MHITPFKQNCATVNLLNNNLSQKKEPSELKQKKSQEEMTNLTYEKKINQDVSQYEKSPISKKTLLEELQKVNKSNLFVNKGLEFNIHEETNRTFVRIVDKEKDEVIKEIPPTEFLDLIAKIWCNAGIMVDQKI